MLALPQLDFLYNNLSYFHGPNLVIPLMHLFYSLEMPPASAEPLLAACTLDCLTLIT